MGPINFLKGAFSKAFAQVNPLDNNRTWSNPQGSMPSSSNLQQPYRDIYNSNQGFSPITTNQFITPHSVPNSQAGQLIQKFYQDDLRRQPTAQESQAALNSYQGGRSLADVQINNIAASNEALGIQQSPVQLRQTLDFLYNAKNQSNNISHQLFGNNPSLGQYHTVGELYENGVPAQQIIQGLRPVTPPSAYQQVINSLHNVYRRLR